MVLDAYLHLGLPRFQSVATALRTMNAAGVAKALACPFETCPDLATVHSALTTAPDRFVVAGIPLGRNAAMIEAGIRAQFAAGFSGLRLSNQDILDHPWILDLIGEARGFALVCGSGGLAEVAGRLLAYLENHDDALVLGGHFAGPREVGVFEAVPDVATLFGHERFGVIFSRQRLFPEEQLDAWARELISRVGWDRLLWGSEAPILHWRDESLFAALSWIDRFGPTAEQRDAFTHGNADRMIFSRPSPPVRPLELPFDPLDYLVSRPSQLWPAGLNLDDALSGRLVESWLEWGGDERGPLSDYLNALLDRELPRS